jgi:hypothetical protein
MHRHDDGIRRSARGRNERKEVRCCNRTHVSNFLSSRTFEQDKRQTLFACALAMQRPVHQTRRWILIVSQR